MVNHSQRNDALSNLMRNLCKSQKDRCGAVEIWTDHRTILGWTPSKNGLRTFISVWWRSLVVYFVPEEASWINQYWEKNIIMLLDVDIVAISTLLRIFTARKASDLDGKTILCRVQERKENIKIWKDPLPKMRMLINDMGSFRISIKREIFAPTWEVKIAE